MQPACSLIRAERTRALRMVARQGLPVTPSATPPSPTACTPGVSRHCTRHCRHGCLVHRSSFSCSSRSLRIPCGRHFGSSLVHRAGAVQRFSPGIGDGQRLCWRCRCRDTRRRLDGHWRGKFYGWRRKCAGTGRGLESGGWRKDARSRAKEKFCWGLAGALTWCGPEVSWLCRRSC